LVVESNNIVADESAMTGEPDGIKKVVPGTSQKGNSFLISGSKVNEGTGAVLVLATGINSQYGKLKVTLQK
jgi:Ca2+-transporting ATPase